MRKEKLILCLVLVLAIGFAVGEIEAYINRIRDLQNQVSTLQPEISDLQNRVSTCEIEKSVLQDLVDNLTNQISVLENQTVELERQLVLKSEQIAMLQNYTSNLQVQIVSLKQQCGCLKIHGLCYSPFRDGQDPDFGPYPTEEHIKDDMRLLQNITDCIRTYGSMNSLASIPSLAKQYGLCVYQGVYLGRDPEANEAEINNAVNFAKQGLVESVIVGNEVILQGLLTEAQLIQYIRWVKQILPANIPVTTAEVWSVWRDLPNLVEEVDYILVHVHPFWESQTIDNAAEYVVEKYKELKTKYPDKRIVIGETGWPSASNPSWLEVSSSAVASEENQKKFLEEFTQLAAYNSIEYFYFEAFDEEWKWNEGLSGEILAELLEPRDRIYSGRMVGSSWGILQSNGELKTHLSEFFFKLVPTDSTRKIREIYVGEILSAGYDMGVDSSGRRRDWLSNMNGSMRMAYPAGQSWGTVFITVGKPTDLSRPWKDFSNFQTISLELKGEYGGESVEIGLKDAYDPDDGSETKIGISNLGTDWQTYEFPLSSFHTADLEKVYVVVEFVFTDSTAQTVYFRNIRHLP